VHTADGTKIPRLRIGVLGVITIAVYGSWYYSFGVLLDPIIEDTGWSEPALASTFGASTLLGGLGALAGGWLLDRMGSRAVFTLAAVIGVVAFTLAANAESLGVFTASAAVGGGAFSALGFYHITQTVAVRLSPGASTRAIAVLTIWGAFASAVYLPSTALLVDRLGWRSTLLVVTMSAVITLVVGALMIGTRTTEMPRGLHIFSEIRISLHQPAARRFLLTQGVVGMAMGVVLVYQVPAMTAAGLPLAAASFWAGFRGFSQLLGRLPLMPIVDRIGVVRSLRLSYVAISVGTIALAFAGNPVMAAIYAVVAGFGIGAASPLVGMFSRDVFGRTSLGTAMGTVSLVFLVVGSLGAPMAGWLSVATGSRVIPVAVAGWLCFMAAWALPLPEPPDPALG
jgi:MFS family permease